jgi:hypothetical protein
MEACNPECEEEKFVRQQPELHARREQEVTPEQYHDILGSSIA